MVTSLHQFVEALLLKMDESNFPFAWVQFFRTCWSWQQEGVFWSCLSTEGDKVEWRMSKGHRCYEKSNVYWATWYNKISDICIVAIAGVIIHFPGKVALYFMPPSAGSVTHAAFLSALFVHFRYQGWKPEGNFGTVLQSESLQAATEGSLATAAAQCQPKHGSSFWRQQPRLRNHQLHLEPAQTQRTTDTQLQCQHWDVVEVSFKTSVHCVACKIVFCWKIATSEMDVCVCVCVGGGGANSDIFSVIHQAWWNV